MSPAPENSEVRRVMDLVLSVRAFGDSPSLDQWISVLPWTEPLIERTWLDGAPTRAAAERVLSLAMCILGDAYRELNRPSEAAAVYRRALDLNVGAPCIDYYSKLVLDHSLADYYAHAAAALPRNATHWRQTSFAMRWFSYAVTLFSTPRGLIRYWRDAASRNQRICELRNRAEQHAQSSIVGAMNPRQQ